MSQTLGRSHRGKRDLTKDVLLGQRGAEEEQPSSAQIHSMNREQCLKEAHREDPPKSFASQMKVSSGRKEKDRVVRLEVLGASLSPHWRQKKGG